jgi:hypothetical protein
MAVVSSTPDLPIEVVKTKSAYWVFGYICCFAGPFNTYQQAENHRKALLKKWRTQTKY